MSHKDLSQELDEPPPEEPPLGVNAGFCSTFLAVLWSWVCPRADFYRFGISYCKFPGVPSCSIRPTYRC